MHISFKHIIMEENFMNMATESKVLGHFKDMHP